MVRMGSWCSCHRRELPASSEAVFGEPSPLFCAARGQLHAGAGGWGGGAGSSLRHHKGGRQASLTLTQTCQASQPPKRDRMDRSLDCVHVARRAGRTAREMPKGRMCAGTQAAFMKNQLGDAERKDVCWDPGCLHEESAAGAPCLLPLDPHMVWPHSTEILQGPGDSRG